MSGPARILEVTSYPPPRAGWGIRVEFLKKRLERDGHQCVVLNIGTSRMIPSTEYETVLGGSDFVSKVWRFARRGFVVHAHGNGDALKGLLLAILAECLGLLSGRRPFLTFHAGAIQRYFPRAKSWKFAPLFWLLFLLPRRIICNSEAVKSCIRGYGVPASKIVPIPAFSRGYMEFTRVPLPATLEAFLARYPSAIFTYVRMRPLFYPLTMIEAMARVAARRPDAGLILCGVSGHMDEGVWPDVQAAIARHDLSSKICILEDLDHDAFLTTIERSSLYLRTPITDGVASSVLESMALGIPVVACENGTRPKGVITYPADDPERMAEAIEHVLSNRADVIDAMGRFEIRDTLSEEVRLLTS